MVEPEFVARKRQMRCHVRSPEMFRTRTSDFVLATTI